jgi:2-dehydropantoate 2-reductase
MGDVALQIIRECAAVGRAEGANLEESVADVVLAAQRAAPADSVNSMLSDRQAGRPVEIDARNGVIVRLGRRHGIPTPANSMAVALMEVLVAKA